MHIRRHLAALSILAAGAGIVAPPTATADCNYAGGSSLCASGDVRGPSGNPGPSAPYSPYPCYDYGDPLCLAYDNYDPGIIFDFGIGGRPVDPGFSVPIRPGGGGRPGIGPR